MFKVPEEYRIRGGSVGSDPSYGNNGAFIINRGRTKLFIIASDANEWEHVSIHAETDFKERTPTWAEMCLVKDKFWGQEDRVVQFHPPKSEYKNLHKHCLHLWRHVSEEFPHPPLILV